MKILLEMRPALDGHAGIPQATRLLFRGLSTVDGVKVEGLLQSSNRVIARGLPSPDSRAYRRMTLDERIHRQSRVVISARPSDRHFVLEWLSNSARSLLVPIPMVLRMLLGVKHKLGVFEGAQFPDFVWRELFARTLPAEDFPLVSSARLRVMRVPWNLTHAVALWTRRIGLPLYPQLDTSDFDVMVAETPFPGIVSRRTRLVVRYHDAIPLLMPHTIIDKSFHQAAHLRALQRNVKSGAWFACVSEATRRDLLSVFPQVGERAVTIHNMISHDYFVEASSPARIPEILRTRQNPKARAGGAIVNRPGRPLEYLLMVSTVEPRKNHLALLAAWERLRVERHPELKLVIVGSLGWHHKAIVRRFQPWLDRGDVQMLEDVPAGELRLLYAHARATVCPSFGEGFDFSGVEAMRCGGVVAASDIPVHREIYEHAAEYFNPYSTDDVAQAVARLLDPQQEGRRRALVAAGAEVSARYLPERVLPQWHRFLAGLCGAPVQDEAAPAAAGAPRRAAQVVTNIPQSPPQAASATSAATSGGSSSASNAG